MTQGFADLLIHGDQTRPDLFDIKVAGRPKMLYEADDVIEARERVTIEGWTFDPEQKTADEWVVRAEAAGEGESVKIGISGEAVRILEKLDEERIRQDLEKLFAKGVRSIAVCLLHSYTYPGK